MAQKEYKTRHDWVWNVMHQELCKKFKFDHTNKWYMHNPASVPVKKTHKHQWDFNIQIYHLISARWHDLIIINSKKRELAKLWTSVTANHKVKLKDSEKKGNYLDLALELKNVSDVYTNCDWCSWYSHLRIIKRTGGLGNYRTRGDYSNYYIIEIGQNIEKRPGDLRRLAVTRKSVKDHQLMLVWKTLKK